MSCAFLIFTRADFKHQIVYDGRNKLKTHGQSTAFNAHLISCAISCSFAEISLTCIVIFYFTLTFPCPNFDSFY